MSLFVNYLKGISKNLPSFRCAVDLVGRLHNKTAGILTYVSRFFVQDDGKDTVQMGGVRFLEVSYIKYYSKKSRVYIKYTLHYKWQ